MANHYIYFDIFASIVVRDYKKVLCPVESNKYMNTK